MKRRCFVTILVVAAGSSAAGCIAFDGGRSDGENDPNEQRRDSIFIENEDEQTYEGRLMVEQGDEALLDARYSVPPRTGLEIPDIGAVGKRYAVTATFADQTIEYEWKIRDCERDDGTPYPGDNTDLGVAVIDGTLGVGSNDCNAFSYGIDTDLEYVDHEEYRQE